MNHVLLFVGGPKDGVVLEYPCLPRVLTFQGRFPQWPNEFRIVDYVRSPTDPCRYLYHDA